MKPAGDQELASSAMKTWMTAANAPHTGSSEMRGNGLAFAVMFAGD